MTRPITVAIPHELGQSEARKRIEAGIDRFAQQFGDQVKLEKTWDEQKLSFRGKAVGQTISGRLEVGEKDVKMEVDLPPFFAMLAEKVKGRLKKEGQLMLEKK